MRKTRSIGWVGGKELKNLALSPLLPLSGALSCWLGLELAGRPQLRCTVYRLRSEEAAHLCVRAGAAAERTEELGLVAFVPPFVDP